MSMTTSARGLSFWAMMRSRICTTELVPRTYLKDRILQPTCELAGLLPCADRLFRSSGVRQRERHAHQGVSHASPITQDFGELLRLPQRRESSFELSEPEKRGDQR